jgi:hypothetical protein
MAPTQKPELGTRSSGSACASCRFLRVGTSSYNLHASHGRTPQHHTPAVLGLSNNVCAEP